MKQRLLIIGAGTYGAVAAEIAKDMACFEVVHFLDDKRTVSESGEPVVGTTAELALLSSRYTHAVVAIGNPMVRRSFLERIHTETTLLSATLLSPRAYVSPSAVIASGCIVEPMATVHTGVVLGEGCIISAGAVVNHAALLGEDVHVDCNATVCNGAVVARGIKIESAQVYGGKASDAFGAVHTTHPDIFSERNHV